MLLYSFRLLQTMRFVLAFFFSTLLFTSCIHQHSWLTQRIATGDVQYDSLRVYYPAQDKVNDIEVEILKTKATCSLTLSVHGGPIPPCENDPEHTYLRVKFAGRDIITEKASLHAGGQRIRPSQSLQEEIINHLRSGGAVGIALQGYRTTIEPDNFPQLAPQLDELPHFRDFEWPTF